jgi:3-oxoacyl-[acyl-carrier-protein] synthase II
MKTFIRSAAIVSPQKTADQGFPGEITAYTDIPYLRCIEPVYKDYLDPMVSRRMSRIVKMGVCAALDCLRKAGTNMPDGIVVGTGLGCLEDTEKFLGSVYQYEEHLLNPTPFINSTHNTVAGAIALAIKCHGYNATYTHRGFSFESAVQDAMMLTAENPAGRFLTGAFDEITPDTYAITKRLGLWRKTIPGEGVAFFLLTGKEDAGNLAQLVSMRTLFKPGSAAEVEQELENFVRESGITMADIDLAVLGMHGDPAGDAFYHPVLQGILNRTPRARFKHLCGEYDTSSSFALWLASQAIHTQQLPDWMQVGEKKPDKIDHVLIYNHLRGVNHSFYLLSSC